MRLAEFVKKVFVDQSEVKQSLPKTFWPAKVLGKRDCQETELPDVATLAALTADRLDTQRLSESDQRHLKKMQLQKHFGLGSWRDNRNYLMAKLHICDGYSVE